jgi:CheY-like chemotaxis protein
MRHGRQLRRLSEVLNVGRFAGFGRGVCPKKPRRFGVRARPETPHWFVASRADYLTSSQRQEKMSGFTNLTTRSDISMSNFDREGVRARILLVDDEEEARDLAALTLTEYTLICARDFDEGLHIARRGYFDLYILDCWLPDKSGVELCRAIREFDPHTPILFYSAAAYAKDVQEGLLAGAQAYLTKPAIPADLKQAVSQLISAPRETAS